MYQLCVLVVCISFIPQCLATCYLPNGTSVDETQGKRIQRPCNNTPGIHSMCCYLEGTSTPDTCTPDGLCLPYDNVHLWRDACTDPTWQDPACLNICTRGQSKQIFTKTNRRHHTPPIRAIR